MSNKPSAAPNRPISPSCCGREMTLLGEQERSGHRVGVWRCLVCEDWHSGLSWRSPNLGTTWVGAMGRLIHELKVQAVAGSFGLEVTLVDPWGNPYEFPPKP